MKRKDMIEKVGHALCKVGAWRKAQPGEFCRGGKSYGIPGSKTSSAAGELVAMKTIVENFTVRESPNAPGEPPARANK